MKTCIDLKERFGRKYRVAYEASYEAERGRCARGHEPWLLIIPCRFGHIYPQGGELLAASTNHRGPIAHRLASLPCVRMLQDGDDGINVALNVEDFAKVARVMKPRRRRMLSSEKRVEQTERLRLYRFARAAQIAHDEHERDAA
jgi:hypothetical protein